MLDALHGSNAPSSGSGADSFNGLLKRTGVVIDSCKVIICFVSITSFTYKIQTLRRRSVEMVRTDELEVVWNKPNPVDDKWIEFINENVFKSAISSCTYGMVLCLLIVLRAPRR